MSRESDEAIIAAMKGNVTCKVKGCRNEGEWLPVLTFMMPSGKRPEAELDVPVCSIHKDTLDASVFMLSDLAAPVLGILKGMGYTVPSIRMVTLTWRKRLPDIELTH